MSKVSKLVERYEKLCNEIVVKFCDKQEIDFDGWVGNEVGGIASFVSQYFFTVSDIMLDLTTNQPKGLILSWMNEGTSFNLCNENPQYINYKSYTMGLRYEHLNN